MIAVVLFCLLVFLGGLGISLFGLRHLRAARAVRRWPAAPGLVTESRLLEQQDGEMQPRYAALVRYQFEVDGQPREGLGIDFYDNQSFSTMLYPGESGGKRTEFDGNAGFKDRGAAERVLAAHPVGRRVRVYYDPQDSRRTVLNPRLSAWAWMPLIGGLAICLTAAGLLLAASLD